MKQHTNNQVRVGKKDQKWTYSIHFYTLYATVLIMEMRHHYFSHNALVRYQMVALFQMMNSFSRRDLAAVTILPICNFANSIIQIIKLGRG